MINRAVKILKEGGLVAFPTETVYGLGADAKNPEALLKIFTAKGRPADHPVIVHIATPKQLTEWAVDISEKAWKLAQHFWPGPLTLILKKAPGVLDILTGGQDSIGLRIPNHPLALSLLTEFGDGIAAPSANRFGRISPTTAAAVLEELGEKVDLILDGGNCQIGVESTIVDMRCDKPVILRPGMISRQQIEEVLGCSVVLSGKSTLRVSGNLESHYAPQTKTYLVSSNNLEDYLKQTTALPAVVLSRKKLLTHSPQLNVILMDHDPEGYAHNLYQLLREVDQGHFQQIIVEMPPEEENWAAIRDRLLRAASQTA